MVGWVDGWMDRRVGAWMDGWMDGWVGGWIDEWIDGWIGLWAIHGICNRLFDWLIDECGLESRLG